MVGFLLRAAISALGLWVASQLLDGLHFATPSKLLLAAVLLGIVNALVRPILTFITLPITFITLGLFLLVVNAATIGLVAMMLDGFNIIGFWPGVGAAVITGLVSTVAGWFIGDKKD